MAPAEVPGVARRCAKDRTLRITSRHAERMSSSPDALDAVLAVFAVFAVHNGSHVPPPVDSQNKELIALEGWIGVHN